MSSPGSLTVSKSLIERLQKPICCSDSQDTCRDDAFCSSDPAQWPVVTNGTSKTRLTYPEDDDKPSVPGVPDFCAGYLSWYTKTNCGPLAAELANALAAMPHCAIATSPDEFVRRILSRLPPAQQEGLEQILQKELMTLSSSTAPGCEGFDRAIKSLQGILIEHCGIMYDDDPATGAKAFNADRAEDLNKIAGLCQSTTATEQQKFGWGTFFKGGGVVATAIAVAAIVIRVIKGIVRGAKGISTADEAINSGARGLKHFFGVTIRNVGRSIKYVFGFGWLRGKKPPPDVVEPKAAAADSPAMMPKIEIHVHANGETTTISAPAGATEDLPAAERESAPHPDVVRAQLANLAKSRRSSREGLHFTSLTEVAQRYLAHFLVERWARETEDVRQTSRDEDDRLTEGKLPIGYLLAFARKYLAKEEMLPVIEASAKVWQERGESRATHNNLPLAISFQPTVEEVRRQLLFDPRFGRASVVAQEYLVRRAIARWDALQDGEKFFFVRPRDQVQGGALPIGFIRFFRKKEMPISPAIEARAALHFQAQHEVPELASAPFSLADARVSLLVRAWDYLPHSIRHEFLMADDEAREGEAPPALPRSFLAHIRTALRISLSHRPALEPASHPWSAIDAPPHAYRNHNLRDTMAKIVAVSPQAASYPSLLEQRARMIIDGWLSFDRRFQIRFLENDAAIAMDGPSTVPGPWIPRSYIALWLTLAGGIGTASRTAADAMAATSETENAPPMTDPKKNDPGKKGGPSSGGQNGGSGGPVDPHTSSGSGSKATTAHPQQKAGPLLGGIIVEPETAEQLSAALLYSPAAVNQDMETSPLRLLPFAGTTLSPAVGTFIPVALSARGGAMVR